MHRILFEMETSDPDDFMTLLWLSDHPDVDLAGVPVTPARSIATTRHRSVLCRPAGCGEVPRAPPAPLLP